MTASTLQVERGFGKPLRLELDPVLVSAASLLLLLGLIMVGSASVSIAERELGEPFYYLNRQAMFVGAGVAAALVFLSVPTVVWQKTSFLLLPLALVLLAVVLIPGVGHAVNGSTRWLPLGPVNLQVSEPARLFMLMYLAGYIVRRHDEIQTSFKGFVKPLVFVILACGLLLAEPDFGAATVLLATTLGLMFVAGVRLKDFLLLFLTSTAAMAGLAWSSAYRLKRLTVFLDPWADPYNAGFQLTQSLIAIGRGEWLGVGLGNSVQKLFYLPEAHTDFVFAVLAEELGLAGVVFTLALFAVLVWRIFRLARRAAEAGMGFQAFLALGLAVWLALQTLINVGVTMGLLPTKGLTLPLMSYGGSSLLVTCAALGLVFRIHHELATVGVSARRKKADVRIAGPAKRRGRR